VVCFVDLHNEKNTISSEKKDLQDIERRDENVP
jgi:hypothetical protein